MTPISDESRFSFRSLITTTLIICAAGCVVLYIAGIPKHPPGFYIDESSIAYNAHLIAQTGHDEHGTSWPLYFRAFGDFKNPTYIYLLAAVFKLAGLSIGVARGLAFQHHDERVGCLLAADLAAGAGRQGKLVDLCCFTMDACHWLVFPVLVRIVLRYHACLSFARND